MNDTATDSETRPAWRDAWPMRPLPLDVVPPLATLATLAALLSMVLNQLVLPGLGSLVRAPHFAKLAQLARFSANLAVSAGLITLVSCVAWAILGRPRLQVQRQVFVLISAVAVAHVAIVAMLFDPLIASREQIYFSVAAANLIGMSLGSAAIGSTRGGFRVLAVGLTALAVFNITTVLLEFAPDAQLDPWAHSAVAFTKAAGEVIYLLLLTAAFPLLVPRGLRARVLFARSVGFAVLVLAFYAQLTARRALQADYSLLVYSAQRVSLWLDHSPLAYAVPFCLLLSATTTALLSGGSAQVQAATGMLSIFAAGYATRAPGRLLTLAVGFMLLARALIALTEQAPFRSIAPPPPAPAKPSLPPSNSAP
jgi:hypothetical protein